MRLIDADALEKTDLSPEPWYSPLWGYSEWEIEDAPTIGWHQYPKDKPKETGRYLTTNKRGRVDITCWGRMLFPNKAKKPVWYDSDSEWGDYEVDDVVAWMPLPEPYEEVSE